MPNYNVNNNYYASAFTEYSNSDYSVTDSEDIEDIQYIIYEPDESATVCSSTSVVFKLCTFFIGFFIVLVFNPDSKEPASSADIDSFFSFLVDISFFII